MAYKNEKQIEDALWHIQRAFEMEPRWREVREEVRLISQLYTGHRPGRLRLNGAALSRISMREGKYDEAVKQLKSEVETQDNRVDLLVALAESEWFAQRHEQAVQTARKVLQELPLCLKINLILGQFYAQQDDLASADYFLRVAQQLDPANELSAAWFGKAGYLQAKDVIIPLNNDLNQNEDQTKMPKWLTNLSLFAAYDTSEQEPQEPQEPQTATSIDDSLEFDLSESAESAFVDANPIAQADDRPLISIDSDFDLDLSSEPAIDSSRTVELDPSSDWVDEMGADDDVIEPNIIEERTPLPSSSSSSSASSSSSSSSSASSSSTLSPPSSVNEALARPTSTLPDWREALHNESWAALNQLSALESPSTAAEASSQADWVAVLRAKTESALGVLQTETQTDVVQEAQAPAEAVIRDELSPAQAQDSTSLAQIAAEEAEPQAQMASSEKEDRSAPWQAALASATHAALADFEAEQAPPAQATAEWQPALAAATHAALAAYQSQAEAQQAQAEAQQTQAKAQQTEPEAEPVSAIAEKREEDAVAVVAQEQEQAPTGPLVETKETKDADIAPVGSIVTEKPASFAGIIEQTTDISGQVSDQQELLSAVAHTAPAETDSAQATEAAAPSFEAEASADRPAKLDWHHRLMAATHAALADYEAVQSEKDASAPVVTPLTWRQQLKQETNAALADYDLANYDAANAQKEASIDATPASEWRQRLTSATHAALAAYEAEQETKLAVPSAISEEDTPSIVNDPVEAAWKDALKVETQVELASWVAQEEVETAIDPAVTALSAIEEVQEEVETAIDPVATAVAPTSDSAEPAFVVPIAQTEEIQPASEQRRPLGKRWIEELRFETEVWLATMRRTHRKNDWLQPLAEPTSVPIVAEKEPTAIQPPLQIIPEPSDLAQPARLPLVEETTVAPKAEEMRPAPSEEAVGTWVAALRSQTEQELSAKSTWVAPLHQETQAELASLSTQQPTWVAALRVTSDAQLAEVAQKVDLVSQTADVAKEISSLVTETTEVVTTQASEEVNLLESSDDFSRSQAPETTEVVTTQASEEVNLPSSSDDFSRSDVTETTEVVTTQASEEVNLLESSDDFSRSQAPETTEVVTTPEVEELDLPSGSDDFTGSHAPETTEVVTTDFEISSPMVDVAPQVAPDSDLVSQTPDVTDAIYESIPEARPVSPSRTNGTAIGHPVAQDEWQLARQAWQVGRHKEAHAIYQTFFDKSDEYDTQLDEALSAWTRADDAPFLAFQLLGDVYRRMRRMQEAVKQYREAINRI